MSYRNYPQPSVSSSVTRRSQMSSLSGKHSNLSINSTTRPLCWNDSSLSTNRSNNITSSHFKNSLIQSNDKYSNYKTKNLQVKEKTENIIEPYKTSHLLSDLEEISKQIKNFSVSNMKKSNSNLSVTNTVNSNNMNVNKFKNLPNYPPPPKSLKLSNRNTQKEKEKKGLLPTNLSAKQRSSSTYPAHPSEINSRIKKLVPITKDDDSTIEQKDYISKFFKEKQEKLNYFPNEPTPHLRFQKVMAEEEDEPEEPTSNFSLNNGFYGLYSKKGETGLQNLGNTCFMNCVLQCLSKTKPLLELILNSDVSKEIHKPNFKGTLTEAYESLFYSMWRGQNTISPNLFRMEVGKLSRLFATHNQQDAQEFLMYLLQGLHEELNRAVDKEINFDLKAAKNKLLKNNLSVQEKSQLSWDIHKTFEDSFIFDTFGGQLRSCLTCSFCGFVSNTFDPFLGLSIPIKINKTGETTLEDCFELFTQEERLGDNEKTICSKCQKKQNSTKKLSIQRFPNILVIHLKRFNMNRSKLIDFVSFPVRKLDLSKYSDPPNQNKALYNLYGVCNHTGSLNGGHYTACTKNPFSRKWFHFNDNRVFSCSSEMVVSPEAYILFFEKVNQ